MRTYHVAPTGNNFRHGLDRDHAWKSVAFASPRLDSGDALEIHGGTYNENITAIPAGSAGAYTRVYATPGEAVWFQPTTQSPGGSVVWLDGPYAYIEFERIHLDGTKAPANSVWTSTNNGHDVHHIRFRQCEMIAGVLMDGTVISLGAHNLMTATGGNEVLQCKLHGGGYPGNCGFSCAAYGVYVQGPNNLIEDCDIYDTSGAGIHLYGGSGPLPHNNIIRRNRIHDITRAGVASQVWGILNADGNNNQIYNNLIYRIKVPGSEGHAGNAGIAISRTGNKVWHNTLHDVSVNGIVLDGNAVNTEVRNNIISQQTGVAWSNAGTGTIESHNLRDGHDPLFVNAAGSDFRLTAGSPAIDTGVTISAVTTDIAGIARPQGSAPDQGAHEFTGSTSPPDPGPSPAPAGAWTVTGTLTVDLVAAPKLP